jgi:hypothetical protein
MRFFRILMALTATLLAAPFATPAARAADPSIFSNWSAVVVAGDWHSQGNTPSTAFDNARREIAKRLPMIGFNPANIRQMSARLDLYPDPNVWHADPRTLTSLLKQLLPSAPGGCFIYWTAHGAPERQGYISGVVADETMLSPGGLRGILDDTCRDKPTILIISACFSGQFIPPLQAPNRMILTAARADRASFGCGIDNVYTFFDECILNSFAVVHDFPGLAKAAQDCVAAREQRENMSPPSEPQVSIGEKIAPLLAQATFPSVPASLP